MTNQIHFLDNQEFILNHLIHGEIKRGKSFGIHFFQDELHLIDTITKPCNEYGIWEAKIKIRHPKTKNWVQKSKPSTFFPTSWTQEILLVKLNEAFNTQIRIENYRTIGKTTCGIQVSFFYKSNKVIGCYPMYENEKLK